MTNLDMSNIKILTYRYLKKNSNLILRTVPFNTINIYIYIYEFIDVINFKWITQKISYLIIQSSHEVSNIKNNIS